MRINTHFLPGVLLMGMAVSAFAVDLSKPGETVVRKEMTSAEAFETAVRLGKANGILVGPQAESLHKETRSAEPTLIDIEKDTVLPNGCQVLFMTLTQPNVPTRTEANAGNFVSKTKLTLCRSGVQPEVEVVGCTVGTQDCMPR